MSDPLFLLLIVAALGVGSIAKGVTGIGLPLLAVPLLSAFVGVQHAVVLMVLPSIVSNGWLIFVHRHHAPSARLLMPFLVPGMIGGALGTWLLALADERSLTQLLAVWLGLYLVMALALPDWRLPYAARLAPLFGAVAGTVQGATGISAPVIAPWLIGVGLAKEAFVFSISLSFTLFSVVQTGAMAYAGLWTPGRLLEGLVALVPVMIFLQTGVRWARRIDAVTFRRILLAIFVLMEARLIYSGFFR